MCVYNSCNLKSIFLHEAFSDILDIGKLQSFIIKHQPDMIFHLAAQPLVRKSYFYPSETFLTNIVGTLNILEVVRKTKHSIPIVNITSDKCYKNLELGKPFTEDDILGGNDPYSSSKACAELISLSYAKSFSSSGFRLSTVRAGNVIGGGDYSEDRIIPDCVRAIHTKKKLKVRSKLSTRPWQHVLDPLYGYLLVGHQLSKEKDFKFESWNFGPSTSSVQNVEQILTYLKARYPSFFWEEMRVQSGLSEAKLLSVNSDKAKHKLSWVCKWDFEKTLDETFDWYDASLMNQNMLDFSFDQIDRYISSGC
jgi:CDP-glucose 4,6-dehydratase